MGDILAAAPLVRGTEFFLNDSGVRLFGTCGQRAMASVASSQTGNDVNPLGIYDTMLAHNWCSVGGATPINGLVNYANQAHLALAANADGSAAVRWYGEPWGDWLAWCEYHMERGNPIVLEVAAGQQLVDAISGAHENAVNLQYHFIALLGSNAGGWSTRAGKILEPGFWVADGDSFAGNNDNAHGFAAANVLQYYPDTVLDAARPCAALALKGRNIAMAWTKLANNTGRDGQGHVCGQGFIDELLTTGDAAADGLLSETYLPDKTSFLPLASGKVYSYDGAVHTEAGAEVSLKLFNLWQQAQKAAEASASSAAAASAASSYQARFEALVAKITDDLKAA